MPSTVGPLVWSVSIQMLDSVLAPRSAAYVSGPLQTGKLYYEACTGRAAEGTDVRTENGRRLSAFAAALREQLSYPVLDPGLLHVDGWTSREYLQLYIEILCRYAREVWFIDGWQYSSGATAEYRAAADAGIPCLVQTGEPLTPERAAALIERAARDVEGLGLDARSLTLHAA